MSHSPRTSRQQALPDAEVVARIRAGDTALYGVLMDRYHRRLYYVALRFLRDASEAEDALQDAYILAMTHLDQFSGRSSFYTWMVRITINEALTRLRRRRFAEPLDAAAASPRDAHHFVTRVPTPEQQAIRNETAATVRACARSLPRSYREVLAIRELEDFSTAEAAERLGLTEECVKTRLHRARELMHARLTTRLGSRRAA